MATRTRLHWFWRGTIAVLIGAASNYILAGAAIIIRLGADVPDRLVIPVYFLLAPVPAVAAWGFVNRRFGLSVPDGELHCRRCNHILRGLSEPRCPECGEPI